MSRKFPLQGIAIAALLTITGLLGTGCGGASGIPDGSAGRTPAPTGITVTPTASETAGYAKTGGQTSPTPFPSPALPTPGASDSMLGYVSGRVVSIAPDHIVVHTADKGDVVLYPAYYRIWDGLWVKDIPTEVGDTMTASDAAFGGPQLYVNIVNLIGTISNVKREADLLLFEMRYDVRYAGQSRTDTIKVELRARVSGSGPREGQRGQVIGRRLKDGSVLGVTVFYVDAGESQDTGPAPTGPTAFRAKPTGG